MNGDTSLETNDTDTKGRGSNMTTTATPIEALKDAHRATWDSGDYAAVADRYVGPVGQAALERAGSLAGRKVLDVATGAGLAAIPAAQAGGRVTGLDLTPSLLEVAAARSRRAGLDVNWVAGDAEALPFDPEAFDVVLSVVGVQFAPRHEVVAAELARVLRPGGRLVVCSWTPSGFIGQVLRAVGARMPAPPAEASPPPLWGDEGHVSGLFAPHALRFGFETDAAEFSHESPEAFIEFMADNYGPLLKARERLLADSSWDELRGELIAICERFNEDAGGFSARSEYLIASGVKDA
jgi:SAM-dependent methyltransferase